MKHATEIPESHISGFQDEVRKASAQDANIFFNWFDNSGGGLDASFNKGQCEFTLYVLMPLLHLLGDTKEKVALEIGYGGGRLLAAASNAFGKVIGVDIHTCAQVVAAEFAKRGIHNFDLRQTDGKDLPVEDDSIDVVYSFIVLQHVEKIATFHRYLAETYRVLKPKGHAVLFFGRLVHFSENSSSKVLYFLDQLLEAVQANGFREIPANVNHTNLRISMPYARKMCRQLGFTVLRQGVSRKLPRLNVFGGQNFLVLAK